jgi:hypothetical protein
MIIGSHADKLERIMQNMKRHTSEELNKAIRNNPRESRKKWMLEIMERAGKNNSNNINFQLWQQHNNPIELSDQKIAWQKLEYIHENPVKAGFISRIIIFICLDECFAFVEKPEDYLYNSARNYYGMKGLIDIDMLDPLIIFV